MTLRVAVFGTKGQLARALAECALGKDVELTFLGRPEIDLCAPEEAVRAAAALEPDAIVNAAAYTQVDRAEEERELAFQVNAVAPGVFAAWASSVGIPFVHVSTDYVFDGNASAPYKETDATNPLNVYGESKLAGECAVRDANADALIVRTSWVYSPFGRNFVTTMLRNAAQRESVDVVADQFGTPTSAHDLAAALLKALETRGRDGQFAVGLAHFAGRGSASWYDVACKIFALSDSMGGATANVTPITSAQYPTKAMRPAHASLDSTCFEEMFGTRAPDWHVSLTDVIMRLAGRSPLSTSSGVRD